MATDPNLIDRAIGEVKSISSEFSDYTKQRFSHPLFFSLLISFVVFNWRPISIFIFSKQPVESVINHLYTYDNKWAVVSPVLAALIYTLAFPFIKNWIGMLVNHATVKEDGMRHNRNITLAVYKEEEAAHEYKIATRRSGTNEITAMQTLIEEKEALINTLKSSINAATERSSVLEEQSRKMEERLLANYLLKKTQDEEESNMSSGEAKERATVLSFFDSILKHNQTIHPNAPFNDNELAAIMEILNTDEKAWIKKTIKRKTFKGIIPIRIGVVHLLVVRGYFLKTTLGLVKTPKFQFLIDTVKEHALWDSVKA